MPRGLYERTPEQRNKAADNMRRVRITRGWPGSAHTPEKQAARVTPEDRARRWPDWRTANPEKAATANRNSGLVSTAHAYKCECGRIIHGPSAFKHAKATGHLVTKIDNHQETE